MLHEAVKRYAQERCDNALLDLPTAAEHGPWLEAKRAQWLEMLGIDDAYLACDLNPRINQSHDGEKFTVESLHFQAVPGQHISCNLWLPRGQGDGPFPCVIYLCGHSPEAKWWYQPHTRWFAEHGYVCLAIDAIQIGESRGVHYGVFSNHWWHWISQGYSPAGVEVQIARRAMDYLATRSEADATRCGLTGISGGATMSLYAAAADARFTALAPHCIAGTISQIIHDRTLDSHCDCALWINRLQWEVHDVAALIAPRPLLMSFSAGDVLCRPQPIRDMVERLRPLWHRLSAADVLNTSEDDVPHAYSPALCMAIYRFFDKHLKHGDGQVDDAENLPFKTPWIEDRSTSLPFSKLSAYTADEPPSGQRMEDVDRHFIRLPGAMFLPADRSAWETEKTRRIAALREMTFRHFDKAVFVAEHDRGLTKEGRKVSLVEYKTPDGLTLSAGAATLEPAHLISPCWQEANRIGSVVGGPAVEKSHGVVYMRDRGNTSVGEGLSWFVRRAYAAMGLSLPLMQTYDLIHGIAMLRRLEGVDHIALYGDGTNAALSIYAALFGEVDELVLSDPVTTHWDGGPEFPNILRVGDLADHIALLCPMPITFVGHVPNAFAAMYNVYNTCGVGDRIQTIPSIKQWHPKQDQS